MNLHNHTHTPIPEIAQFDTGEGVRIKYTPCAFEAWHAATGSEHVTHGYHIPSVEIDHIKACQAATGREHTTHVYHIGCIETTHIKARQATAAIEH